MKGLIYKELFLGKKTYFGILAVALGLALLGVLVALGIRYGNIQDMEAEEVTRMFHIFVYATYGIIVFFVWEGFFAADRDKVAGWRRLEYTMPITAKKQIGARYLTSGILLLISFLLGLINGGVMAFLFRQTFTGTLFKNMVIILLLVMVVFLAGMPQYQGFSSRVVTVVYMVVIAIASYAFMIASETSKGILWEISVYVMENADRFLNGFLYLSPLIMPVLLTVSFFLSVKAYQRREK